MFKSFSSKTLSFRMQKLKWGVLCGAPCPKKSMKFIIRKTTHTHIYNTHIHSYFEGKNLHKLCRFFPIFWSIRERIKTRRTCNFLFANIYKHEILFVKFYSDERRNRLTWNLRLRFCQIQTHTIVNLPEIVKVLNNIFSFCFKPVKLKKKTYLHI